VDVLARRIETDGPLSSRDAVRLVARLARTVESLHASGGVHGRLGAGAITLSGPRIAQARLLPTESCVEDDAFHSPERRAGGPPSIADDIYAIGLVLYFVLTGWTQPRASEAAAPQNQKPPPLAVFDAGDDTLERILAGALSMEPIARPLTLGALRAELDAWLETEGAPVDDGLPLEGGSEAKVDVASLPPPPAPEGSRPGTQSPKGALFAVQDEESTWRRAEGSERSRSVRPPRLVPPRAARSKAPPPMPSSVVAPPDEDEQRPTLPRADETDERATLSLAVESTDDGRAATPKPNERAAPGTAPLKVRWPIVVGATAAVVVAGYVVSSGSRGPSGSASESASASASASGRSASVPASGATASTSVSASASASAPAPASASASVSASASAGGPEAPADVAACMRSLFPADTFTTGADSLSFVCEEASPIRGAPKVREALVRDGRGKVTDGMKEWAVLGYFELGAYAVLRAHCCGPSAPPLSLPVSPGRCPSLAGPLAAVAQAGRKGAARAAAARAVDELDQAVRCITRSKQTKAFGGYPRPSGGEGTALAKTIARGRGG
jgi:serine/threonine protein kinase